jgi:hypothetical protein
MQINLASFFSEEEGAVNRLRTNSHVFGQFIMRFVDRRAAESFFDGIVEMQAFASLLKTHPHLKVKLLDAAVKYAERAQEAKLTEQLDAVLAKQ